MNALRAAASAASDATTLLRRTAGDSTVAVGGLVARLAVQVSGALANGEFAIPSTPTAAGAAAASAAASSEEEEYAAAVAAGAADDESVGARIPRFLVPAHGAVVVVVGGGPVGLWTAAQLKLMRPLWRIVVAERHATYLRSHVLRVDALSFAGVVPHPEAHAFVARLLGGRARVAVRTTELEAALRTLSAALGVAVMAGEPVRALPLGAGRWLEAGGGGGGGGGGGASQHSAALRAALESASAVVVADGARSPGRRLLLGGEGGSGTREAASLAHMVHVRYEVAGAATALKPMQAAALFNAMGLVGEEYVGKPRRGATPCTLTLVIDDESLLGGLRGAAAQPLAGAPLQTRLRTAITLWLNCKAEIHGETRVRGSEVIAAVNLSVYCAQKFVAYASVIAPKSASEKTQVAAEGAAAAKGPSGETPDEEAAPATSPLLGDLATVLPPDVAFAIVGDAAFGVPFYRSLNNGLMCASELAAALSKHGDAAGNAWRIDATQGSVPLEAYARFVDRLATQELAAARMRARAFLTASLGAATTHALAETYKIAPRAGSIVFGAARIDHWRNTPLVLDALTLTDQRGGGSGGDA
jgi:hypothetical protein